MGAIKRIAVAGAGTMGAGIAQLSALAGFETILFDISAQQTDLALQSIQTNLDKAVSKQIITQDAAKQALSLIQLSNDVQSVRADLIIEAIVEQIDIKKGLYKTLAHNNTPSTIIASNTSSFPITRLASGIPHPERIIGMHFFNPAHIMKLVEIISGAETSPEVVETVKAIAEKMGKTVVLVKDAPGFIVNRVARHYYLEGLKLLEENVASFETIDELAEATGFKMGPFRLQDMIGIDINYTVTESMYQAFHFETRFRPSRIQEQKKDAGHLGRKSGIGFYRY